MVHWYIILIILVSVTMILLGVMDYVNNLAIYAKTSKGFTIWTNILLIVGGISSLLLTILLL